MKIYRISASTRIFNKKRAYSNPTAPRASEYLSMTLFGCWLVIEFYYGNPINVRVFTLQKEHDKFIESQKISYLSYEEHKQSPYGATYPGRGEKVPF